MGGRLFGTDGVRGRANADLTPELALAVAVAAAHVLAERATPTVTPTVTLPVTGPDPMSPAPPRRRPIAVVGRDPRASGEMLEAAVVAGLASAGADVLRLGVLPTPAVAYLVAETGADLGVMLSASHNPMPDNGIKLFAAGGHKLPDDVEDEIESAVQATPRAWVRPTGAGVGRVLDVPDAAERYLKHLVDTVGLSLDGVKVVVDCAHGAASRVAPEAYRRAGADVVAINAEPDGLNINDGCGSTHLEPLRKAVVSHGADIGIAHDGDADRCLAVAADGSDVDGDQIMAILALGAKQAGTLVRNTLVATVMSNLGLHIAMREHEISLVTTAVGDRYVLDALRTEGFSLGGEQSGHVVMPEYATTGDGVLTGLHLLARLAATGKPLVELASVVRRLPQVLVNVAVADKRAATEAPEVASAVAAAEAELGDSGRVLLRPSGTEPLVRVMVEALTEEHANAVAGRIADAVTAAGSA